MPGIKTLLLHHGGLRSLIATAMCVQEDPPAQIAILTFSQPGDRARRCLGAVQQQAQHFQIPKIVQAQLPALEHLQAVRRDDQPAPLTYAMPRMMLFALTQAIAFEARRVVLPVQVDADYDAQARLLEQSVLVGQIVELEHPRVLPFQMPLVDLSDKQLIELGSQLQVPWHLAWSCLHGRSEPCRTCQACVRRAQAFGAADIADDLPKASADMDLGSSA